VLANYRESIGDKGVPVATDLAEAFTELAKRVTAFKRTYESKATQLITTLRTPLFDVETGINRILVCDVNVLSCFLCLFPNRSIPARNITSANKSRADVNYNASKVETRLTELRGIWGWILMDINHIEAQLEACSADTNDDAQFQMKIKELEEQYIKLRGSVDLYARARWRVS